MQNPTDKTDKLNLATEREIFDRLVAKNHPFRRLGEIIDFQALTEPLRECYSDLGRNGIDVENGFKALLVQFWEDYSDREMEKGVRENIAIRWFCGFDLTEDTPDHTYFCRLRTRLGPERIAKLCNEVNTVLKEHGLFGNIFHFIDASSIISKTTLWEERDRAIKNGEAALNNLVVKRYAVDKDARWGAKSKNHIWFGYKRHHAVDMRYGLIEKTTVTAANVLDFKVLDNICPEGGMVFMDKLYDCKLADQTLRFHGCHAGTIRKRNHKQKNRDLDRWRSQVRMPFEGIFSKFRKRAKYHGLPKITLQNFFEVIVHNLKKAITILPRPPVLG